jgi:hypothetical protein
LIENISQSRQAAIHLIGGCSRGRITRAVAKQIRANDPTLEREGVSHPLHGQA